MQDLKIYTAINTGSRAVQVIANELGLEANIIHYDTDNKTLSDGGDIRDVNPLMYVPVITASDLDAPLTETPMILTYLADHFPESGLIPEEGTAERRRAEQLMFYNGTEIAQKQIPLLRKLLTPEGWAFHTNKVFTAYQQLDKILADGRDYLLGDTFSVVDAFVWSTHWVDEETVNISSLKHLTAYLARVAARPSVRKTEADLDDFRPIVKAA